MYQLFAANRPGIGAVHPAGTGRAGPQPSVGHEVLAGKPQDEAGGVAFEAGLDGIYRANLHLRTANRVLARMGEFYAAAFSELRKKASRLPWETASAPRAAGGGARHLSQIAPVPFRRGGGAHCRGDWRPAGQGKLRWSSSTRPPRAALNWWWRAWSTTRCTLALDTSGDLLHRRGYRLETAKAPLRETLAAGMLLASGWERQRAAGRPLLRFWHACPSRPRCWRAGLRRARTAALPSWTGAIMTPASGASCWRRLPGRNCPPCPRPSWPPTATLAQSRWRSPTRGAPACWRISPLPARRSATWRRRPARAGWSCNPPYGVRVSPTRDLRNLYARFGDVLRAACPGWQVGMLCSDAILAGHTHLPFQRELALVNGGIGVRLYVGAVG